MKLFFQISLIILSLSIYGADKFDKDNMPKEEIKGDVKNGSQLVSTCIACHGQDGNSINSEWPKLAGQNQRYLYEQLQYFKNGDRRNALMNTVTPYLNSLSNDDIRDIAAYYASMEVSIGRAKNDIEMLELGEALYRNGNLKKGIPACTACHSVYGEGNSQAGFPSVAGQQVGYLVSTLKAYKSGERAAGEYATVMQAISMNLSEYEIEALANYMHGIYKK